MGRGFSLEAQMPKITRFSAQAIRTPRLSLDVDRYNDPVDLASLEISEEGKNEVEVYAAGQLKNLRSAEGQVSGIEVKDDHTLVNITVRVRLLRTSYLWTSSFFTEGILSMYYTCGQKLPLAIFKVSLAGYVPCVKTLRFLM